MNRHAQAPAVRTPRGSTSAEDGVWFTSTTGGGSSSAGVKGGGALRLAAIASVARARSRTVCPQLMDVPLRLLPRCPGTPNFMLDQPVQGQRMWRIGSGALIALW